MELVLNHREATGYAVTEALFGVNLLFKRNDVSSEDGQESSFAQATEALGASGLRYPGGTMTEKWGADFYAAPNTRPAHLEAGDAFVGLDQFLQFAGAQGQGATIVLPTAHLLTGEGDGVTLRPLDAAALADLKAFVMSLMEDLEGIHPGAVIEAFEIGNEYFSDFVHMTSAEYGLVANAVAIAVQDALDQVLGTSGAQPDILVQMADQWGPDFDETGAYGTAGLTWFEQMDQANTDLLDQLTDPAFRAIDGVIEHYYYGNGDVALTTGEDPSRSRDLDIYEINRDLDLWRSVWAMGGYGDFSVAITEWGIGAGNTAQFGLKGTGVMLDLFEAMLRSGVDSAMAWPVELGGPHDLAGAHDGRDGANSDALTPLGEAFRLMAENTIGTELLDNGFSAAHSAQELIEVNSFGSDEKFVFFVSSRSDEAQSVTLDVSAYVSDFAAMSGELVQLADDTRGVNDPGAFAQAVKLDAEVLGGGNVIDVELAPFEVLMVTYTLFEGETFQGEEGADVLKGGRGNDVLHGAAGADHLVGERGDDTLLGGSGDDLLSGWAGHDTLSGNGGNDQLFGDAGQDVISGGLGNDTLGGGADDDLLRAGGGDDLLSGDAGQDLLFGGFGDDRLDGGAGGDVLFGGLGSDVFVFTASAGSDVILDFELGVDRVDLAGSATSDWGDMTLSSASRVLGGEETTEGTLLTHTDGEILFAGLTQAQVLALDFLF